MIVLLQYPDMRSAPVGVWWVNPEGGLESHYVEESPAEVLARHSFAQKKDGVPWELFFEHLAGRSPRPVWYEVLEVEESPVKFLERVRRMAQRA